MYCFRPDDELLNIDPTTYDGIAKTAEYRGSRPRYAGFRRYGNRDADWQEKLITPVCSKAETGWGMPNWVLTEFGDTTTTIWSRGWDENPVQVADGCQEIAVDFQNGQHRSLRWRYVGQVEPDDSTDPIFSAQPNGEQLWMEGNTTAMRVGLDKAAGDYPGQYYWRRQWHTPLYPQESSGIDNDRPISETEFGLGNDDGVVIFETTTSGGNSWGAFTIKEFEFDKIYWGMNVNASRRVSRESRFVNSTWQDGNSIVLDVLSVDRGSGQISRTRDTSALPSGGFPNSEFGYVKLAISNEDAQRLFGYNGNDEVLYVEIIVGGKDTNGAVMSEVLVRPSWDQADAFVLLSVQTPLEIASPRLYFDHETGQLYAIGGQTAGGALDRIWALDFTQGTWVNTWRNAENGVLLDPTMTSAAYAVDVNGGKTYLVATDQVATRVSRFEATERGPVIEELRFNALGFGAREGAAVEYSERLGGVVLYGGYDVASQTYRNDVWLLKPEANVLRSLGGEVPTVQVGRKNARIVVGDTGQLFVLGGETQYGPVSADFTLAFDPTKASEAWAVSGMAEERTLNADGTPQRGVFRPGEPSIYRLVAGLGGAQSASVQVSLNNVGALELLAVSPTGEMKRGRSGLLTLDTHRGEEWQIAVRALDGNANAAAGTEYMLTAEHAVQDAMVGQISTMPWTRFDVEGDIIYVANWNKLLVYRRIGGTLTKIGQLSMLGAADVEVVGHVAFVADLFDGLVTVNVSNPASPAVMDKEWVLGMPDSVAVRGNSVFLGAGLFGVQVVDATDPGNLMWNDSICVDDIVVDVSVSGDHLLIGDLLNGIEVFALNRDGTASQVGSYTSWGWVEDSAVRGSTMYVKDFGGGLEVVDLRVPSNPQRVSVATTGGTREVSGRLGDDMIALPGALSGVKVYDIKQQ